MAQRPGSPDLQYVSNSFDHRLRMIGVNEVAGVGGNQELSASPHPTAELLSPLLRHRIRVKFGVER